MSEYLYFSSWIVGFRVALSAMPHEPNFTEPFFNDSILEAGRMNVASCAPGHASSSLQLARQAGEAWPLCHRVIGSRVPSLAGSGNVDGGQPGA